MLETLRYIVMITYDGFSLRIAYSYYAILAIKLRKLISSIVPLVSKPKLETILLSKHARNKLTSKIKIKLSTDMLI